MRTTALCLLCALVLTAAGLRFVPAQSKVNHDKLSDADRKALGERFEKEVWPIFSKGKDNCLSCHLVQKKVLTQLKLSGDAQKDFRMMVREGFFLADDEGSILGMVTHRDPELRMPQGRGRLADADIKVIREFTAELNKRQKK
jgi:hypothetical protein